MLVAIVFALLMFLTIFMPYASATKEHAEMLEISSNDYAFEELNMKLKDLKNISMFEYAKVYGNMSEELFGDPAEGIIYVVVVALIAIFSIGVLTFTLFRRPIAVIVFDILAFIVFCMQNWDYKDRGIIPSEYYNWGAAYYMFFICAIAVFVCSVTAIVLKTIAKKKTIVTES